MKTMMVVSLFVVVFATVGWIANIVKLTGCDFEAPYKCEVMRSIGIVPVIGAVMGYITLDEERDND